ncbi:MAG: DUF445 family protein [Cyanobacteria bacterium P01_D01_bin.73]
MVANWWILLVPPIAGGVIGYFTNDLAIKMLFRPYKPIFLGDFRIPLTPGLIPRNQGRLARRVSDAIMGSLLTPSELEKIARRLLDVKRTQAALEWLLHLALEQLQGDRQKRTAQILGDVLRDFVGESLPRLLRVWSRSEDFLKEQINQVLDQLIADYQLTQSQARRLAQWVVDAVLTPNALRLALIDFLTEENIRLLDSSFRERSRGTYWVIANVFGVRNTLSSVRVFCINNPAQANQQLAEIFRDLRVRDRLYQWLKKASPKDLPASSMRRIRRTIRHSFRTYLQGRGIDVLQDLGKTANWEELANAILGRLQTSPVLQESFEPVSYELALILDRYLERDLEKIVAQAIPILDLDNVIVDRVMATPAQNLETAIQGIVRDELQAIIYIGGILGVVIGLMQSVFLLFQM